MPGLMRRHLTTLPQPTKNWLFSPNIVRAVASCLFLALSLLEHTRSRLCEHLVTLPVSYSRFGERLVCRSTWLIAAVERPFRQHDALPSAISRFGGKIWLDWQAAERAMPSGGARLQAWWLFFCQADAHQYNYTDASIHLYHMSQTVVRMACAGELLAMVATRNCQYPE